MRYTTNLQLPLFESGDAVDLIAVYNAAMSILDTTIATVDTKLTKTSTGMTVGDLAALKITTGGYIAKSDSNNE